MRTVVCQDRPGTDRTKTQLKSARFAQVVAHASELVAAEAEAVVSAQ